MCSFGTPIGILLLLPISFFFILGTRERGVRILSCAMHFVFSVQNLAYYSCLDEGGKIGRGLTCQPHLTDNKTKRLTTAFRNLPYIGQISQQFLQVLLRVVLLCHLLHILLQATLTLTRITLAILCV